MRIMNTFTRRSFLSTTAAGTAGFVIPGLMTGCSVITNGAQSLNRGVVINSTSKACQVVRVVRFPSRAKWEFSGILAGKTAEIGFPPTDLLDEKAVISWTEAGQHHRVHLLLPATDISGQGALAYQLLPDGRATVHVASLSGLRDTGFPYRTSVGKHSTGSRTTVDDVLKFAIAEEEKAEQFYTRLSKKMKVPETRESLLRFAGEERKHKGHLLAIRARGPVIGSSDEEVTNLEISDYTVDARPTRDMQYYDALSLAIKRERAAQRLYIALAALADAAEIKSIFRHLAEAEARHELLLKAESVSYLRG
jgi:rubrerythrin